MGAPVELQAWRLETGEAKYVEYATGSDERLVIDLLPTLEASGVGCLASAQGFERSSGATLRIVPMALSVRPELLSLPPAPDAPEDVQPEEIPSTARPVGQTVGIPSPLGFPALRMPEVNPPTAETIGLGRRLFYEPVLSADGTIACASCHDPAPDSVTPDHYLWE